MARVLTAAPAGDGHEDTAGLLKHGKIYRAKLVEIKDTTKRKFQSEEYENAYRLVFMVHRADGAELGTVSKKYKPSIHEKAKLTEVVTAITGKAPIPGFDADSLIGKNCQLLIDIWTTDNGVEKNGIKTVLPADDDDDMPPPAKLETTNIQPRI